MRKLWILMVLAACFGLVVPGCSGGDDGAKKDDATKKVEDATKKAEEATKK